MGEASLNNTTRRSVLKSLGAGAALGAIPLAVSAAEDPIFGAIEAHKAAYAAWMPFLDVESDQICGTPEYEAARLAAAPYSEAETSAMYALCEVTPTTIAGISALLKYILNEQPDCLNWEEYPVRLLSNIAKAHG